MADLFDLRVGGAGWHLTSHLIAIAALFVACFAITGYITFRDESIPVKALDKDQDADDDIKVDNVTAKSLDVSGNATLSDATTVGGDLIIRSTTLFGNYGDEKVTGTTKLYDVGTRMQLPDGNVFRYAFANGALAAGQMVQESAAIANHDMDLAVATTAIGATTVTVTPGATAVTADQYAGGSLYVNDGANLGEGQVYRVKSHPAADASTAFVVTLSEGLTQAFTNGTTLVGLKANSYFDCIPVPATPTARVLGAPRADIADNAYGWIQTWGEASLLVDTCVPVVGEDIYASTTQSGAIENTVGKDIISGTRVKGAVLEAMDFADSAVTSGDVIVSQGGTGAADFSGATAAVTTASAETSTTLIYSFLKSDLTFLPKVGDIVSVSVDGTVSAAGADGSAQAEITAVITGAVDGALTGGLTNANNYHIQLSQSLCEPTLGAEIDGAGDFSIHSFRMLTPNSSQRVGIALAIPAVDTDYQLSYLQLSP